VNYLGGFSGLSYFGAITIDPVPRNGQRAVKMVQVIDV
jgi:hypothetical protein